VGGGGGGCSQRKKEQSRIRLLPNMRNVDRYKKGHQRRKYSLKGTDVVGHNRPRVDAMNLRRSKKTKDFGLDQKKLQIPKIQ
jgi:hypothetical protein